MWSETEMTKDENMEYLPVVGNSWGTLCPCFRPKNNDGQALHASDIRGRIRNSYASPRRSVYIRLCKYRKKGFYCFYKLTFPRKTQNTLLWHCLKEKFLPFLYMKSCPRNQFLFCKKDAFRNKDFSRL